MKILIYALFIVSLLSLSLVSTASASHGEALGSCPPNFELHHHSDGEGEPHHRHIGVDQDLNGDGYICMKVLVGDLHLHIDNFLPVP